ncbi:GntR family transcriptional regulator [Aureimonas flava]|uniref:GntR family transcriptional regulator n=2 Tax=Aureimonas flava TaxID=2320271 RepID=A0A3A1WG66_9HYPH|nr:GntR family transcriptional regulator [Aureimonas flava]
MAMAARVADTLRERIVRGSLEPGARIVERRLSAELEVSRTPIREALKLLEADGLIQISRNRGAQVTGYPAEEALQLFDVIAVLEGLAAERLARTIQPPLLARFEGLHAEMLSHFRHRTLDAYFNANSAIHDLIVASCANPRLAENHQRLMLRARRGRFLAIMSDDRWKQSVDEHEQLMEALRKRDAAAAFATWRMHLDHTGATVARVLMQRSDERADG